MPLVLEPRQMKTRPLPGARTVAGLGSRALGAGSLLFAAFFIAVSFARTLERQLASLLFRAPRLDS
jgi:hypothetical protein